ncbi:Sn1-specific diacylglycerol lipase beta [Seminavis robusta]|uniref:sn-1-specific diacylglycerol lipase n=1 Tax=Seminavis robusta TaxID=568900 RepID=A0A9N8EMT6_9STRA|nr:Sn1-specific diacylglycerol lipase beta [Seminavis robusta]|eukprot:Sro1278_g258770.1 Sn1-specific diacylglycerol lipase beta (571) ;mRNA; r:10702-12585
MAAATKTAEKEATRSDLAMIDIQGQLHDLRLDMRRLQVNGLAGNLFFWWVHPVKFLADPVFEVAELIVPAVSSKVPFADVLVDVTLGVTEAVAHAVFGVTASTGLISSNKELEDVRTLSQLQALKDQSDVMKEKFLNALYEEAGKKQFLLGVHESAFQSTSTHRDELLELMYQGYSALYNFANDAGIFEEAQEMGHRFIENKALLGVIQQADLNKMKKERFEEMLMDNQTVAKRQILDKFPLQEAAYFMKFATAAYGDNGIKSSKIDNEHEFDWRKGDMTATRVSEHTGIPTNDLVSFDVKYDGDIQQLRHFVALDHKRKKVVLAIRGTYTHREAMIDFNGYSRDFMGGESHAAISIMAERLWDAVGDNVIGWMDKYQDYELIVCGHSLGGGSTCVVNLLLHADERMQGRKWRAFAYASPPVCVPLANVAKEAQTCVNYINQYDGVPFLSGDSVRHQLAMIAAVNQADLSLIQRGRILLGLDSVDDSLIAKIHDIQRKPHPVAKPGFPSHMAVPAMGNVWMVPDKAIGNHQYKAVIADSVKMSETGIFIHKDDLADHLPARYEYVFKRVR